MAARRTSGVWCAGLVFVAAALAQPAPAAQVSADAGVYSEAQARRGETAYLRSCERCHLVDLRGDSGEEIPELTGPAFLERWSDRTVDDLYQKVSRTMPATAPASLGGSDYIDITAFLLQANGFPPGPRPLEPEAARRVRFAAVAAQRDEADARLAPLDVFEIRQLNARFVHGLDSAANDGYMFADVFTGDGTYVDADGATYQGRERLAAFARQDSDGRKGPTNVRHYIANELVEAAPGGARGRGYVLMATRGQAGPATVAAARDALTDGGQYWDELVRTPQGWRIHRRVLVGLGGAAPAPHPLPAARTEGRSAGGPQPGLGLSADDYAAIYQLYAKYGYTFDSAADRGYAWARLFTDDGFHVNAINPLEFTRGRDANALLAAGGLRLGGGFIRINPAPAAKNPNSIAHILTSILLQPTPDGVIGKAYRLTGAITPDGRVTVAPGGVYFDLIVKGPEGWQYQESWYLRPDLAVPDGAKRFLAAGDAMSGGSTGRRP